MKKKRIIILLIFIFVCFLILTFHMLTLNKDGINYTDKLKGKWIADGTQHQFIIGYEDGEFIYSDNSTPFYLEFDDLGNYILNMGEQTERGTYSFNEDSVILKNSEGLITEKCELKKDELHCEKYASLYIKK